jgi:hypothetical protein
MSLTPEAKKLLAETIRNLRAKLLLAIHDEADRRYRLSVPLREAGLDEAHARRRERIEAWIDEQARAQKPKNPKELKATKDRLLAQAEKEAAATLVNRLVLLRQLEAAGLSKPQVVIGGWNSKGYREFRDFAPALCTNGTTDATEGYATLLGLLFDELSVDLPGLYGDVGLTELFGVPPATLREVIEHLDNPELASAWADDTTLGWVYQDWNDGERDALDQKILGGGKVEPFEIASKTQLFTDRYIVGWLLQNSLGLTWLAMCQKQGWTADAERVLPVLDARRGEWRKMREDGRVALDALMPIETELEDRWKYYVPQAIPDDAMQHAPESVHALKLLDPACGSGHFLVIAFDLLAALYEEEARHRGQKISAREVAESILDNNLHGIDIDPRAIQIAAAGLYLKCRTFAKDARPRALHLVAPALALGNLPSNDPAVVRLREELRDEVGIPQELTGQMLAALGGVDHLGSLLKVDAAVEEALRNVELEFERKHGQGDLFGGFPAQQVKLTVGEAKATVLAKLELFLARHSNSEDLGLRLDGEQLASGVRFVRIAKEGAYDIVTGNPPYQALAKTAALGYVAKTYPRGKADLCTAFLERSLELARPGGFSAMVAMRSWMFLGQFTELREHLVREFDLRTLGDLDKGAFESMPTSQLISVAMTVFHVSSPSTSTAVALQPTAPGEKFWGPDRTDLKRAAILAQRGSYEFDPRGFEVIEGKPIIYSWSPAFLRIYRSLPKVADSMAMRVGVQTSNDSRFLRRPWEITPRALWLRNFRSDSTEDGKPFRWAPFVKGAEGRAWFEPVEFIINWFGAGIEIGTFARSRYGRGASFYFRPGLAFTETGHTFAARLHRFRSVIGDKGMSAYPTDLANALCLLNSTATRELLESLAPGIDFQLEDVKRVPYREIKEARRIQEQLDAAFTSHESTRESSVEFKRPGASPWTYAQAWAQRAVDRPDDEPLPPYEPAFDKPDFGASLSFWIGVALGRFDAHGAGILDRAPPTALPGGILFVSSESNDSLDHLACKRLVDEFQREAPNHSETSGYALSEYVRKAFFGYHKKLYEHRPIYFPLSSAKKSFVAFASIHRWQDDTLNVLLADYLVPTRRRLEGELDDLRTARASSSNKGKTERRFAEVQKLLEELNDFIAKVTEVAENGPAQVDDKTEKREVNAKYLMDLDDGVMVNSAALWTLLEPQWKDPKKWWTELSNAQGKKDYDWSHLAARYFPTRVRAKCHEDPSLSVAHHCFWELHPAKAYAWELRLQDEIKPGFTIDEPGSDAARDKFLSEHDREATEIYASELKRRERRTAKQDADQESAQPLFDRVEHDVAEEADDE